MTGNIFYIKNMTRDDNLILFKIGCLYGDFNQVVVLLDRYNTPDSILYAIMEDEISILNGYNQDHFITRDHHYYLEENNYHISIETLTFTIGESLYSYPILYTISY